MRSTTHGRRSVVRIVALLVAVAAACAGCEADTLGERAPTAAGVTRPEASTHNAPARTAPARTAPTPESPRTAPANPSAPAGALVLTGTIARVVDGDTVHVRVRGFDTVVRLIGVDTPETRHPTRPVECWGPEASTHAKRLLPEGAAVRLESDPSQDVRDRYDRLLAYVYTEGREGAASVNRALVAAGSGRAYVYGGIPFRYAATFTRAEAAARSAGRGLWGPPCHGTTAASTTTTPAPTPRTAGEGGCDPNYRGACVPPYPPDVNCRDVGRPVTVVGADPHNLDGDRNGRGCEGEGP